MRNGEPRLTCVLAVLLAALPLTGQVETGQIVGTVTDPTGAVIPNAKVTVRAEATQVSRSSTTNEAGLYTFANLLPGVYEITVEASGFNTLRRSVTLAVGARVTADFRMEVGRTETVVEVAASAVQVNTATQTLGVVIDRQDVVELPSLTRNPYDFVVTAGNVSEADPSGRGVGVAINGQRAASTNILLDGAANNDEFTATVGQTVPLDSVQEFSILTNNFTAEFGRASGGIVNVATKSGTNEFHGTAYEFNRVSRLTSNTPENNANGVPRSVFTRNQFGYSIGGPIKRDKAFFFQNTEWIRIRSAAAQYAWIPTPQFIGAAAPNTRDFFAKLGKRRSDLQSLGIFSRNQLIAQGFDPCAGAAAGGPCQRLDPNMPLFEKVTYNVPRDAGGGDPQNALLLVGRLDYNVSERTQFYGRYALEDRNIFEGTVSDSPYDGFNTGEKVRNQSYLVSLIHTPTPRFVAQSKLVFNRLNGLQPLGPAGVVPTLYMLDRRAVFLGTSVALPGYLPYAPGTGIPFGGPQNFLQAYEDLSYTKGAHQFRFGGSYVYLRDNRTFGAYQQAAETLSTRFGTAMDNFLTGQLLRFQAAIDPQGKYPCGATVTPQCTVQLPVGPPSFSRSNRYHEFAIYFQDSWRIRPRMMLNLGLRWEYFGVQHHKDPKLDSNYYDGGGGNIFQRIRNGDVAIVPHSPIRGLWRKDWDNFAPRIGFAWDITGDGRTSFRAGYGIGYERNFGNVTFNVIQNPPAYAVIALTAGVDLPMIPITVDNAGPLAGSTGTKALPRVSLRNVDADIRTAYAHFWSASVEREVSRGLVVGLDYSGSKGQKLYSLENPNLVGAGHVYLGDPCPSPGDPFVCTNRLRLTQYTNINRRGGQGFSDYHGLNLRTTIRDLGNTGLSLTANYTWSHAIDNLSSTFSERSNNFNLGLMDPFDPKLDRGDADFDLRHRIGLGAHWNIPFARNTRGPVNRMLDGWVLAPIFTARTGNPYTLWDTTNAYYWVIPRAMFDGPVKRSPTKNPPAAAQPNRFKFLDLTGAPINSSYVHPITGTAEFGPWPKNMTGRNAFRSPGAWNLDLGVYKNTRVNERYTVQFRAEFYNMPNHPNLIIDGGETDVASVEFVPALKTGRRNIQFALKLIF
ncbi:MAG: TonB-dependent receptor [Bryobacteraceae bacterium]|nr:TonB-dependent receptor [Bryobacteraceae bacterium]